MRPKSEVGRPGSRPTCTDVHAKFWLEGQSTDPVDRPESSALWKGPGRPDGESALCIQATVDRPVDRWLNGQKSDRWPVDQAVDLAPNG